MSLTKGVLPSASHHEFHHEGLTTRTGICYKGGRGGLKGGGGGWLGPPSDALAGKGPQRRPQKRLGRRLEEVIKAVGGGYCRLRMPLKLALAASGAVAGHRLSALKGGLPPPLPMHPRPLLPGSPYSPRRRGAENF